MESSFFNIPAMLGVLSRILLEKLTIIAVSDEAKKNMDVILSPFTTSTDAIT